MTDHAPGQSGPEGPTSTRPGQGTGLDRAFGWIRSQRLQRRSDDKWIGGVCSGVADRLGIDPVIVRAGFVLLGLLAGVGVTIYLVAWLLLPDDRGEIAAEKAIRDGHTSSIVLLIITAVALFNGFPWWFGGRVFGSVWFPWPLLFVAALIWWFWIRRDGHRSRRSGQLAAPITTPRQYPDEQAGPGNRAASVPSAALPLADGSPRTGRGLDEPPRRTAGGLAVAVVSLGVALITYGILQWAGAEYSFTGNHQVIAAAGALAALGLILLAVGLAGRRGGLVGLLAVLVAAATLAASSAPGGFTFDGRIGDATWAPNSISADANYHLAAGNAVMDLGKLPADGLQEARVPVFIGAGQLQIAVPSNLTVRIKAHVAAGEITVPVGSDVIATDGRQDSTSSGLNVTRDVTIGSGPTEVVVDAGVGAGQIHITQSQT